MLYNMVHVCSNCRCPKATDKYVFPLPPNPYTSTPWRERVRVSERVRERKSLRREEQRGRVHSMSGPGKCRTAGIPHLAKRVLPPVGEDPVGAAQRGVH